MLMRKTIECEGFNVVMVPTASPIVTVRAVVNAGAAQDKAYGTAHFLEHMFFKGTKKCGYEVMNRLLSTIGEANAYTDRDKTVFHIETLGENAAKAFGLLCEMLFEPAMEEAEFEKERTVIAEEWRASQDQPFGYFFNRAAGLIFDEPFAVPILGTEESICQMKLDDLNAFRRRNYNRTNIAFILVGDLSRITERDIRCELMRYVPQPTLDGGKLNRLPAAHLHRRSPSIRESFDHSSDQAIVSLWVPTFSELADRKVGYQTGIFYNALGQGLHSLLADRVREKAGLAYSVGAFELNYREALNVGCLYAMTDPKNVDACVAEMNKVIEEVKEKGVEADLLKVAKSNFLFGHAQAECSPSGAASTYYDDYFYLRDGMDDVAHHDYQDVKQLVESHDDRDFVRRYANEAFVNPTIVVMNAAKE